MFAKLRGRVDGTSEDTAVIDVNGVGYLVHCSARTLGQLAQVDGEVALQIETQVREDRIQLFGFLVETERAWFRLLNGVQGVGARVALGMLGTLRVEEIVQAIALQDKAPLTRAPSVGPKLAQRIRDAWALRAEGRCTVPSTVGLERETNPFMRYDQPSIRAALAQQGLGSPGSDSEVFAATRALKDRKDYKQMSDSDLPLT